MRSMRFGLIVAIVALTAPSFVFAQSESESTPKSSKTPSTKPTTVKAAAAKAAVKPAQAAQPAKAAAVPGAAPKVNVVRGPQQAKPASGQPVARVALAPGANVTRIATTSRPQTTYSGLKAAGRYGTVPAASSSPYAPPLEKQAPPPDDGSPRSLSLFNVNTQESINVTYKRGGQFIPSELEKLGNFLRDSKNGDVIAMDPELFDILWHLQRRLGGSGFEVLSAYRSPETNAVLARMSRGVARNSLHMQGQAIDIKMPGISTFQIRQAARDLGLGGVGYYPRTGFVHVDTGPVRYW